MLSDIPGPKGVVILIVYVLVQTILLGLYLTVFRPGEAGRYAPRGSFDEWKICLLFSFLLALIEQFPKILMVALWWVMALCVLRLSIRQTFKLNIALALCYLVIFMGAAAMLNSK
jgi:hypothetical protein